MEKAWKDDWRKAPGNSGQYSGQIQPIEYFVANDMSLLEANILKYVMRYKKKNGVEDLQKALWYLDWLRRSREEVVDDIAAGDFIASQECNSGQKEVILLLEEYYFDQRLGTLARIEEEINKLIEAERG